MNTRWLVFMILACGLIWYRFQLNNREIKRKYPEIFANPISDLEDYSFSKLQTHRENQRVYALGAFVVIAFSLWMGAWQPHQVKVEREKQHQAFLGGYAEGWDAYCDDIFNNYPMANGGILYANNIPFAASWCEGLIGDGDAQEAYVKDGAGVSSEYSSVSSSNEEGWSWGFQDSMFAVFSMVPYLCYGTECISESSEIDRMAELSRYEGY